MKLKLLCEDQHSQQLFCQTNKNKREIEARAELQHQMLILNLPLSDIDCRQWNSEDKFGNPRLQTTSISHFIWNTRSCQSDIYYNTMTWKQQTERACHNSQPPSMPKNFRRTSKCSLGHLERFGTQLRNGQQEDSLGFDEGHKKNIFPLRKLSFFIHKIVLITIYLHLLLPNNKVVLILK